LVAQDTTEDDRSEPEHPAAEPDILTIQVVEEVENARGRVFEAYVRARERARRLGALDDADTK
jgi:hypothetical protein